MDNILSHLDVDSYLRGQHPVLWSTLIVIGVLIAVIYSASVLNRAVRDVREALVAGDHRAAAWRVGFYAAWVVGAIDLFGPWPDPLNSTHSLTLGLAYVCATLFVDFFAVMSMSSNRLPDWDWIQSRIALRDSAARTVHEAV